MPDVYLYAGEANPNDVKLSDPTVLRSGGGTVIEATGQSAGACLVDGVAAAVWNSLGSSAGTASVTGISGATVGSVGNASGQGVALGVAPNVVESTGSSSGQASAVGASDRLGTFKDTYTGPPGLITAPSRSPYLAGVYIRKRTR